MNNSTCSISGCDTKECGSRGWCWAHYNKWRRQGDPMFRFEQKLCKVDECEAASRVMGMCDMHYRRVRASGDPYAGRPVYGDQCSIDACQESTSQAGMCGHHYYLRWTTTGNGKTVRASASASRRARVSRSPVIEPGLSWRLIWSEGLRDCYICGIACDISDYRLIMNRAGRSQKICGPTHPSLDHITPLAKGGGHARDNTGLCCMQCNRRKHSKMDYDPKRV